MKTRNLILIAISLFYSINAQNQIENSFSIVKEGKWGKADVYYLNTDFIVKLPKDANVNNIFSKQDGFTIIDSKEKYNIHHIHANFDFDALKDRNLIEKNIKFISYQPYIIIKSHNQTYKYLSQTLNIGDKSILDNWITYNVDFPCLDDTRTHPDIVNTEVLDYINESMDLMDEIGTDAGFSKINNVIDGVNNGYDMINLFSQLAGYPEPILGSPLIDPAHIKLFWIGYKLIN
jgi:hypothetical protein